MDFFRSLNDVLERNEGFVKIVDKGSRAFIELSLPNTGAKRAGFKTNAEWKPTLENEILTEIKKGDRRSMSNWDIAAEIESKISKFPESISISILVAFDSNKDLDPAKALDDVDGYHGRYRLEGFESNGYLGGEKSVVRGGDREAVYTFNTNNPYAFLRELSYTIGKIAAEYDLEDDLQPLMVKLTYELLQKQNQPQAAASSMTNSLN